MAHRFVVKSRMARHRRWFRCLYWVEPWRHPQACSHEPHPQRLVAVAPWPPHPSGCCVAYYLCTQCGYVWGRGGGVIGNILARELGDFS